MRQKRARSVFDVLLVVLDLLAITLAFALAYQLRRVIPPEPEFLESLASYVPLLAVQLFTIPIVFFFYRLYHVGRAVSRVDQFYSVFGGVSIGTMMAIAIASFVFKNSLFELDYPRAMVIYAWVLDIALINLGRLFHHWLRTRAQARGVGQDRLLIVGTGPVAQMVLQKIQWSPYLGYEVVGFVNGKTTEETAAEVNIVGNSEDLPELITQYDISEVIIALPEPDHQDLLRIISLCERNRVAVKVYPDMFQIMASKMSIDDLGGLPLISIQDTALRGWNLTLKRGLDLLGAAAGLILLSPAMLLVALLIKLESPGPVFYLQERMGLDARPFMVIKFRSMRKDAEKNGPGWTTEDDPRKTRIGNLLRKASIDELPQFINVLFGEMSLVGPRPERPVYVRQFQQSIPRYMERHREKAGMTGWAQVNGLRGDTSIWERTKYDLWYIENWSLWLDIKIIIRTVLQFFTFKSQAY